MRIFIAQQRIDDQLAVVTTLLERRAAADSGEADDRLRDALDRVIEATQRRHPAMASIARGRPPSAVRPAADRPHPRRGRHGDAPARPRPRRARTPSRPSTPPTRMPSSPARCRSHRCSRRAGCSPTTDRPGALLSVLMRRYYKIRDLAPVTIEPRRRLRRRRVAVPAPRPLGRRALGAVGDRRPRCGALGRVGGGGDVEPPDTAVVDLYLMIPADDHPTADELAELIAEQLDAAVLPPAIRRVAVIAVHPDRAVADPAVHVPTRRRGRRGAVLDAGGDCRRRLRSASPRTASSAASTR